VRVPSWLRAGRTRWYVAGAVVLALAGVLTWVVWPEPADAPRERRYRNVTACLLTDGEGITGRDAAPVWAGMQEMSLRTLARVQFVAVSGEQTPANAAAYLAGLTQGSCDVVVAVGAAPVGAVAQNAGRSPDVQFVSVGGAASAPNVAIVDGTGNLRASVSQIVETMVGRR
jgi:hypothetical protein